MDNMEIRSGEQLSFSISQADPDSVSATFLAQSDNNIITDTVNFVDGIAFFEFNSPETDVIGTYNYQINENFATGSPDIYPSPKNCKDSCSFPQLRICKSLPEGS